MPAIEHLFFLTGFLLNHPLIKTITIHSTGLSNTMTNFEIANIMIQDTLRNVKTQK